MHAAGNNVSSDIYRMANLLQVSSAFGRAMESVNRYEMCLALYPVLQQAMRGNSLTELEIRNAVHASAEGYSFPTNLDRDPPVDGLAPKTQAQFVLEALAAGLSQDDLKAAAWRSQRPSAKLAWRQPMTDRGVDMAAGVMRLSFSIYGSILFDDAYLPFVANMTPDKETGDRQIKHPRSSIKAVSAWQSQRTFFSSCLISFGLII